MSYPAADTTSSPEASAAPAQWAEAGIGPAWRYNFIGWLMRFGGKARGYHIAFFASLWYALLYPSIRRRCSYYLARRFPDRTRWSQRWLDAFRLIHSYGVTLTDMQVVHTLGPGTISARSPQHDALVERCQQERGFVLLNAHVGCFQIGISALKAFSKQVWIFMIPGERLPPFAGEKPPVIVDPRSGLSGVVTMTEALLHGDIVAMMGDRVFGNDQNTTTVQFLGKPARFPITPYRLASATGTPVLVMTAPKITPTNYELRIGKVIEVPANLGRNPQAYAPYAQQYADCIEEFAREFPFQVYNFFDVWDQSSPKGK